jgi:hypothetical protein
VCPFQADAWPNLFVVMLGAVQADQLPEFLRVAAVLVGIACVLALIGAAVWIIAVHLIRTLNQHLDE